MTTTIKSVVLSALLIPAAAIAGMDVGQHLGTTKAEVRAAFTSMGYHVRDIEIENDEIEAEVTMDGVALEIEVALDTGLITEIEAGDDDHKIDN